MIANKLILCTLLLLGTLLCVFAFSFAYTSCSMFSFQGTLGGWVGGLSQYGNYFGLIPVSRMYVLD